MFGGEQNAARHLRREVCGRNEVDVVTAARLQFEHHLRQTLVRDFILELLFVRLRDLIVLAVDAAQIAVAEENVAGAVRADERGLFAEVRGVGRNDRQPSRIAGGDFVVEAVVETVARADGAALEQRLQSFDAGAEFARLKQREI